LLVLFLFFLYARSSRDYKHDHLRSGKLRRSPLPLKTFRLFPPKNRAVFSKNTGASSSQASRQTAGMPLPAPVFSPHLSPINSSFRFGVARLVPRDHSLHLCVDDFSLGTLLRLGSTRTRQRAILRCFFFFKLALPCLFFYCTAWLFSENFLSEIGNLRRSVSPIGFVYPPLSRGQPPPFVRPQISFPEISFKVPTAPVPGNLFPSS